ncbi:hypothetical protein Tco_1311137 [Tanacetum coccineum]
MSQPVSTTFQPPLPTSTATVTAITTTTSLPPPPPQPQQSTADPILVRRIGELEQHMADLLQDNLSLGERLHKHGTRLYNLEKFDIRHKLRQAVEEIVTDVVDWAMQAPLRARFRDLSTVDMKEILQQRMFEDDSYKANNVHNDLYEALQKSLESPPSQPPPPRPPAGVSGAPYTSGASGSSQLPPPLPPPSTDDLMHDDSAPDEQVHVSDDQDSGDDHTPAVAASRKDCYEPPTKNSLLAKIGGMTTFLNWYCHQINKSKLTQADLEGQAYEVVKNSSSTKICMPALSISKMKDARYPDFGLELLVPEQMWIEDVCTYDISAKSPNTHADSQCSPNQSLFTIRYDYLSEIVLRRADFQEHTIAEKDFKNLYPSDFEDLNLLLLQGHLDHLSGSDKRMLSTAVKLWTRWDATGYEFKHDYTIIESPRAVIFPVNNNERKIMRFNEIYKFSDGTLKRILETLDYNVKEFKIKRLNSGMNTRFWTEKDVTRSKEFITAIERRLKTRRIYRNLECFVGGRVRDIDYRLLQRTE